MTDQELQQLARETWLDAIEQLQLGKRESGVNVILSALKQTDEHAELHAELHAAQGRGDPWTENHAYCRNCGVIQHNQWDAICTTCQRLTLCKIPKALRDAHNAAFDREILAIENASKGEPRICDQCSRKLEDRELYNDHSGKWPEGYDITSFLHGDNPKGEDKMTIEEIKHRQRMIDFAKATSENGSWEKMYNAMQSLTPEELAKAIQELKRKYPESFPK